MTDVNLYSLEIEGLVKHKHKLEAEIARLRASTIPHTDQEREDPILDCYAVIKEKDAEIERLRARALAMPSEEEIAAILKSNIRLVALEGAGTACEDCGTPLAWRVKEGNIEACARAVLALLAAPQAPTGK